MIESRRVMSGQKLVLSSITAQKERKKVSYARLAALDTWKMIQLFRPARRYSALLVIKPQAVGRGVESLASRASNASATSREAGSSGSFRAYHVLLACPPKVVQVPFGSCQPEEVLSKSGLSCPGQGRQTLKFECASCDSITLQVKLSSFAQSRCLRH